MPFFFPVLIILFYVVVIGLVVFVLLLINKWVTNSIKVKKEQNEILREFLNVVQSKPDSFRP